MKINWEHILQNKFNYLLTTQIIIFVTYPFLQTTGGGFPIISLLLLIAITPALWVGLSHRIFLAVMSVGVLGFLFNLVAHIGNMHLKHEGILILLFLYALFYFLAIVILLKRISSKTIVTADTIKGGISIYILLGLFWAVLYMILLTINQDPDIVILSNLDIDNTGFECYYFSFTTLTTLGYGDITPVAEYAKIMAMMESVTGPVYLAIFVAQIIGMNIAQKIKG